MFKKLIERIDSVNDYVNPIVVRDMRRAFGHKQLDVVMIAYICSIIAGCLVFYFFSDLGLLELELAKSESAILSYFWLGGCVWISVIMGAIMVCQYVVRSLDDEMLLITAITPHQYLHACMFEMFLFTTFCTSLFVPVVLIIFWQSSNALIMVAIVLGGNILVAQVAVLVPLSFIARLKQSKQIIYMGLGLYCGSFIFLPMVSPWIFLIFLWTEYFEWSAIDMSNTFGFISIFILLPIALLLTGMTAYRLSLYAFKTRQKSIYKMVLLNIFCYTLLSVSLALIYFCIAYAVFTFL
jgi:hypothetical protein